MTRCGEEVKLDQNTEPGFSAMQQHTTHSTHVGKSACSGPRLWFYNCIPCFITKNEEQVPRCSTCSQPYLKQNKTKPNLKSEWVWHVSNFSIWGDWVLSAPFMEFRHPQFQRLFFLTICKSVMKGTCDIKTQQILLYCLTLKIAYFPIKHQSFLLQLFLYQLV